MELFDTGELYTTLWYSICLDSFRRGKGMKRNCWEVQKCGREPGGKNVMEKGVCPAATIHSLDGAHGGKNAGRCCWLVAGTWCGGEVVGSLAIKYQDCRKCEFFKMEGWI